jgi:hypothetical protein
VVARRLSLVAILLASALPSLARGEEGVVLSDKVHGGSGSLDLLQDVSGEELLGYIGEDGSLLLGVDLNEAASGNESNDSVGVAIDQVTLTLVTSEGTYTFTDIYTSTTAVIQEEGGTTAGEFYTLFGKNGSSEITGNGLDGDLAQFDDVLQVQNISFEGEILEASLDVVFLDTASTGGENETFFDYSNGFEQFALLTQDEAVTLESAEIGVEEAPSSVEFEEDPTALQTQYPVTAGAPTPPITCLLAVAFLLLRRSGLG